MKIRTVLRSPLVYLVFLSLIFLGCGRSREETVAGVKIPVPSGMNRVEGQSIELSLPGFGGGQASFQGKLEPEKVIEFYKKEMPARGWDPNLGVVSRGGMLAYTKEGKSVVVLVGRGEGGTTMTLMVGKAN